MDFTGIYQFLDLYQLVLDLFPFVQYILGWAQIISGYSVGGFLGAW